MLWAFAAGLALAGNPYAGRDADVVVTRFYDATPDMVFAELDDAREVLALNPDPDCLLFAKLPEGPVGVGVRFQYRMQAGPLHRTLWATITKAEPGRYVEWDHEGNRGFVTRYTLTKEGEGTSLEIKSWLNAPPWPFRGTYFKKVQPAWVDCYEGTLDGLKSALTR